LKRLLAAEGFTGPTAAQQLAIPVIESGAHTLLIAPTGMGKTEAAIIPIFDSFIKAALPKKGISILYVTPLRALNRDLLNRLEDWGKALDIDVKVRHGDTTTAERARQSKHPPDMLITTPETVQAMLSGRRLKEHLSSLRWVVVDEVHELAQDERGSQLAVAMERLVEVAGEFQRIGLSATVGDDAEVAAFLCGRRPVTIVKVPILKALDIRVVSPEPTEEDVKTADKVFAKPEAAAYLRVAMAEVMGRRSTLLFVNTRETAEVLSARVHMIDASFPLVVHHGSLSRDVRVMAEEDFREGRARALVCTSSMELGIDIGTADLVLQYNSPRQVTRLVQRVGRAGHRADLVSNGIILATDPDDIAESLVIARRAKAGELEVFKSHKEPLDVLANQLIAYTLSRGRVPIDEAFELFRRSHPFRDMTRKEFDRVVKMLEELHLIFLDEKTISAKRRSYPYFFENLSMIPDEKDFHVVNIVTGKPVATLDESFVSSYIEPSAIFICQGHPWRVLEIDPEKDLIRVEPVKDPLGAIPSWVGEEIPVPFAVAQEVGKLRARIASLSEAQGEDACVEALVSEYPGDRAGILKLVRYVASQRPKVLATHETVTVEFATGKVVVNACFGHRVNETLGRLMTTMLSARLGASVGLDIDPYRIIITVPSRVPPKLILESLHSIEPANILPLLDIVLTNSSYLRHRLVNVARKFGAVERDVDFRKLSVQKLIETFRRTPIYEEAMREVLVDRLDVETTKLVLQGIANEEIRLVVQDLSPIGAAGLDTRIELISPARADRTILAALKNRLSEESVILACVNCCEWKSKRKVAAVPEPIVCGKCASVLVAALRPWHERSLKLISKDKRKLTDDERKEWKRINTNANLVTAHGKRAVIALVARGVGPDTAGRVLYKQRSDEETFLRDVLEAEINYARTRRFWD
jgi:ATP-dependent Lhr-like helicase